MKPSQRQFGLVLSGGLSRRFGSEKAAALLDGRPLLRWALAHLDLSCERTAVSARPGTAAEALAQSEGRVVLADAQEHAAGPLAGVAAGLAWAAGAGAELLAVEPIDMPHLPTDLHARLRSALGHAPAAYAVTSEGPQPLCALWRTEALPAVQAALSGGEHPSVWRLLDGLGAVRLMFENPVDFTNVNRATDLG